MIHELAEAKAAAETRHQESHVALNAEGAERARATRALYVEIVRQLIAGTPTSEIASALGVEDWASAKTGLSQEIGWHVGQWIYDGCPDLDV